MREDATDAYHCSSRTYTRNRGRRTGMSFMMDNNGGFIPIISYETYLRKITVSGASEYVLPRPSDSIHHINRFLSDMIAYTARVHTKLGASNFSLNEAEEAACRPSTYVLHEYIKEVEKGLSSLRENPHAIDSICLKAQMAYLQLRVR